MQSKNSMNVRMLAPRNNPSIPPTSPKIKKNSISNLEVYLSKVFLIPKLFYVFATYINMRCLMTIKWPKKAIICISLVKKCQIIGMIIVSS